MKKRIVSIMLVLTFVLLALPMSVSAGEAHTGSATYTSKFADWSAKLGGISAINGGVLQINAWDENLPTANKTNPKHARLAMWNGELAEGRFSVTLDTAGILAGRGDGNPGANDTGIIFGGKGIKAYSGTGNMYIIENNSQFYFLYFAKNNISLALANKDNYVDADNDPSTPDTQKAWMGTQKNSAGQNLNVDLNAKYKSAWDAAKAAGKVELTVAFSTAGAFRLWINGTHIKELDADNLTPFGTELGVRAGMGWHVPTKIHDFKVYGGLTIKTVSGKVNYDPMTYTWSGSHTKHYDGSIAVAYATNRVVKNGKIVVIAQQVPDVAHTGNAKDCAAYLAGETCTDSAHYKNNYYIGPIFNVESDSTYYFLAMKDTQVTKSSALGPGAVSIQTRVSSMVNGKWTGDATGIGWKAVKYTINAPYTPADPITWNSTTGKITYPSGSSSNFSQTNYQVAEWTNSTPLSGGYYGFRTDVYDDAYKTFMNSMDGKWPSTSANRNANEGAWVQYYVVNDQKEAIDLSLSTGNLDLTNVEKNKEYSVTVSTFPAGSVVNSGDTVELVGNGIKTVSTKDNGNGTYTVKFRATKDGAVDIAAQVDNHIFGTLTSNAASATVVDTGITAPTGDATFLIGAGAALMAILGTAIIIGKKRTVA